MHLLQLWFSAKWLRNPEYYGHFMTSDLSVTSRHRRVDLFSTCCAFAQCTALISWHNADCFTTIATSTWFWWNNFLIQVPLWQPALQIEQFANWCMQHHARAGMLRSQLLLLLPSLPRSATKSTHSMDATSDEFLNVHTWMPVLYFCVSVECWMNALQILHAL